MCLSASYCCGPATALSLLRLDKAVLGPVVRSDDIARVGQQGDAAATGSLSMESACQRLQTLLDVSGGN